LCENLKITRLLFFLPSFYSQCSTDPNDTSPIADDLLDTKDPIIVRDELANMLRIISEDLRFLGQTVVIPDSCEYYGFSEGKHDLPTLLYFLADMLE
jgi:hypothetical protein